MAISIQKYVDINSFVGGVSPVTNRELILRIFTDNVLLPTDSLVEFTSAKQVSDYFGSSSEEYLRAVRYFSFVSKSFTQPNKISYARWVDVATAPMIFGSKFATTLNEFQVIADGSFDLTLGGVTNTLSGIDFSTALSFADVATLLQAAINAQVGVQWTGATVAFNATKGSFDFVGGDAVAADVSVAAAGVGTDLVNLIGWGLAAIFSDGSLVQAITDTLDASSNASNNFGSFVFIPSLSIAEIEEAAQWNSLLDVQYQYYVPVSLANATAYELALESYAGCGVVISESAAEFQEQDPASFMAATNYNGTNSVINYMFQSNNPVTAPVTTDAVSDKLDAERINYYGLTQQAGQKTVFFQRGVLFGDASTYPVDMNTYANEMWLKDEMTVQFMSLFLTLERIPASTEGNVILLNGAQIAINKALNNGSISVGKPLTDQQKAAITNITSDDKAWYQVQTSGYWIDVVIELVGLEYVAKYTLIYSKDDDIRKVEGLHILI